jgi:hypothetical protein
MLTYGQALRAIGQDLESHGALAYEIDVNQAEYRVQCDCELPPPDNLLSFCYTSKILEQIDFMGKLKRTGISSMNSSESLSNTLRTLGSYVDIENGALLRVTNYETQGPEIAYRIEFALANGNRLEKTLSKQVVDEITGSLRQARK